MIKFVSVLGLATISVIYFVKKIYFSPKVSDHLVVLVTTPSLDLAKRIARSLLESRLIACANILPAIQSM